MKPARTTIHGTIRGVDGNPVDGALIEAQLINQMVGERGIVGNEPQKTHSNAWGKFWFELVPNSYDGSKPNNYYVFKIISGNTNYYYKLVPDTADVLTFDELPEFTAPDKRPTFIGGGDTITLGGDYTGVFTYLSIRGDGSRIVFETPGRIHMVALNGIVQRPNADYTSRSDNSVEFAEPPTEDDVILLQYRI